MDFWPGIIGWGYRNQNTAGAEIAEIIGTDLPGALDGWWMSAWETYLTLIDNHVSVASDLSGNGYDAIQNSATLRPIVTTEGFARTLISDSVNLELPTEIGNIIKNSNYAIAMEFYTEGNEDIAFAPIITTGQLPTGRACRLVRAAFGRQTFLLRIFAARQSARSQG